VTKWNSLAALLAAASLTHPIELHAATITGTVTMEGKAISGALVTLYSADRLASETVLTDANGRYRLKSTMHGALTLRARSPLNADDVAQLSLPAGNSRLTHAFTVSRLRTPEAISDSLPASIHFTRVKLPSQAERDLFQLDCTSCHQIGNAITRRPRPLVEWTAFMQVMTKNAEYVTDSHVAKYAAVMNEAFDGTPTVAPPLERLAVDADALRARITEWKLPGAIVAHDTDYYPRDGTFYTVEQNIDQLYVTNPRTNRTEVIPLPALGVPVGGTFAGQSDLPSWVPQVSHGNHSLQLGPDGKFYFTGSIGGEIGVFDPIRRTYQVHRIGGTAMYPHTLRFDSKGIIWFTIYVSNQIGRFDPRTGRTTIIELPPTMATKDERTPAPYGIDINPLDGSVWYTTLFGNMVGRVDPVTFKVQEWQPPVVGPRRARFDKDGGFWIPGFGDGKIARLDTRTMTYDTYAIPTLIPGAVESPYALAVDSRTQDVWITANMSDRMFRFSPRTKTWTAFPLPTRGLFFRDVVITPDGRICAASNPWGVPLKNVVEDDMNSVVCLDPEGNKQGT
jgi:streptogramin lyase